MLAAGVKVLADQLGWTRSTALVRQENADLRERNATLAAEVERLDVLDREKAQRIAALESEVKQLQERDQAAVLEALAAHESSVIRMWDRSFEATSRIAELVASHEAQAVRRNDETAQRHQEALTLWREIRDAHRVTEEGGKG